MKVRYICAVACVALLAGCGKAGAKSADAPPAKPPLPTEISCTTAPQFEAIAMDYFRQSDTVSPYSDLRTIYSNQANMAANMASLGYQKCTSLK